MSLFDRWFTKTPQDWLRKAAKEEVAFRQQRLGLILEGAASMRHGYGSVPSNQDLQALRRRCRDNILACINRALALDENFADAWYYKAHYVGDSEWRAGSEQAMDEALACIEKTVALNPQHADAWFCRARILKDRGLEQQALACFDRVIEIDPGEAEAWWWKSQLLGKAGKEEEAKSCRDKAVSLDARYGQSSWTVPSRGLVRN
jgi:tetratricopeptide (TPR) repeat protein